MKTIYSPKHRLRNAQTELHGGQLVSPFECPERIDYILQALEASKLGTISPPEDYGREPIERVHDLGYLNFLEQCWERWVDAGYKGEAIPIIWPSKSFPSTRIPNEIEGQLGYYCLASESSICEGTAEAALLSAQVALSAQALLNEGASSAFALCRPPGHHAAYDQYGGYCFINNAAVAAQKMLDDGAEKVAILDIDFHHGNGTQAIFYNRNDVFFVSLHGDPMDAFPHFSGFEDEMGIGIGESYNLNFPLPKGTTYSTWCQALETGLKKIQQSGIDALVVSLGVDTFENDPISFFKLKSSNYIDLGKRLARLQKPVLFVMEGGYAVEEIGINTVNVLQGFDEAAR